MSGSAGSGAFRSLRESPNFRRYFLGQTVSQSGTWMQSVGQAWLVLQLSGSAAQVGFVLAVQTLPILLLGPLAGVVVDRHDSRRLLVATNLVFAAQAATLGVLTITDVVTLPMVYALAASYGLVQMVDLPARQTFALALVGPELLTNAVTLNSINMNVARVLGPAMAAGLIAWLGVGECFLVNAASSGAVLVALASLNAERLHPARREARHRGQLREGLAYVWGTPELRIPLGIMAVVGTITYEFSVTLPALADGAFDGSASTLGLMTGAMGLGAVLGGLLTAGRPRNGLAVVARQAGFLGAVVLLLAAAPTLALALGALLLVGAGSLTFLSRANATVQLLADPAKRGRVMALWTMAFLGTTPLGAPLAGWLAEVAGPRWALVVGGAAALAAAAYGALYARRVVPAVPAGVAVAVTGSAGAVAPAGAEPGTIRKSASSS